MSSAAAPPAPSPVRPAPGEAADRLYPARPLLAASCLAVRDGRVLVARRVAPPLVWSAPGGLVEAGESLEAAALRELREETGVSARITGLAGHLEHVAWERGGAAPADEADRVLRHYVIICFAARWIAGEAQVSAEAAAVRWATPAEMAALNVTDGLQELARRALRLAEAPAA
ncbi:NUDIX hydrolase [Camelimonas abortus]|uniref:NUDIX hydrolase n=1 Tax=Camelimonas abortus TaxID=1017184 RepID=A0ABV7LDI9_9HYPH